MGPGGEIVRDPERNPDNAPRRPGAIRRSGRHCSASMALRQAFGVRAYSRSRAAVPEMPSPGCPQSRSRPEPSGGESPPTPAPASCSVACRPAGRSSPPGCRRYGSTPLPATSHLAGSRGQRAPHRHSGGAPAHTSTSRIGNHASQQGSRTWFMGKLRGGMQACSQHKSWRNGAITRLQDRRARRHGPKPFADGIPLCFADQVGLGHHRHIRALELSQDSPTDEPIPRTPTYGLCVREHDHTVEAQTGQVAILPELQRVSNTTRLDNDVLWRVGPLQQLQ